jgi:uncharacterized membrane protein
MIKYLLLYILTVPVFFVIDMLWLGIIARKFYQQQLAHFLGPVNWTAAIIFYLIFIVGIIVFAVLPAINDHNDITKAIALGFLFGFIAYATYDLTNLSTLKNWPLTLVIVDMLWGGILSATVASASFGIAKWIGL